MSSRSKTKGVYFRDGIAYIRYQDERGTDVRESTMSSPQIMTNGLFPTASRAHSTACPFPSGRS